MERKGKDYRFTQTVEWFDSFEEAMHVCKTMRVDHGSMFENSWSGSITDWDHAERMTREGWKAGADRMSASFDAAALASLNTHGEEMRLDIAGFTPCVPSYLAGDPMHMRRKVEINSSKAPITLVVGIGSSGGIDTSTIENRAIAIACLVYYLSVFRPVDLYISTYLSSSASSSSGYYIPVVKLGTTPMDLQALAWRMCHPWASRGLLYGLGNYRNGNIGWAHINGKSTYDMRADEYAKVMKELLGLGPDDIVFPDIKMRDRDMDQPEQWAKTRLAQMGYNMDL